MRTPPNQFYNEFDYESVEPRETDPHRSPFQIDRDRIIYSSAFRRLQSKTQVFVSGEFDFYRTRLTHSLEVAQIGRSICAFLNQTSPLLAADFSIDPDLVEAICLAHDLGHSPFGHAGERALHHLMRSLGGFEGNAQSLRLISETIYSGTQGRRGMNPTRALIDGIQKYKRLFREDCSADNHFLYDEQEPLRRFTVGSAVSDADLDYSKLRSLECQIMDWADDTAYGLSDIVDSINAGFLALMPGFSGLNESRIGQPTRTCSPTNRNISKPSCRPSKNGKSKPVLAGRSARLFGPPRWSRERNLLS
jgi:dGTPase